MVEIRSFIYFYFKFIFHIHNTRTREYLDLPLCLLLKPETIEKEGLLPQNDIYRRKEHIQF